MKISKTIFVLRTTTLVFSVLMMSLFAHTVFVLGGLALSAFGFSDVFVVLDENFTEAFSDIFQVLLVVSGTLLCCLLMQILEPAPVWRKAGHFILYLSVVTVIVMTYGLVAFYQPVRY
jgi:hypothetical protein